MTTSTASPSSHPRLAGTATGFHIHGAATTTETAPVRVDLSALPFHALNISGFLVVGGIGVYAPASFGALVTATNAGHPTMSFLAALQGGLAYVDVHTAANPGGVIRGQLVQVSAVPEPATYGMLALGMVGIGFAAHRRNRG